MPVLKNARHEMFAQSLAKGMSASAAYVAAGYKPNEGNAIRLKGNEKVRARLAELQTRAGERVAISKAWVLQGLRAVAERCLQSAPVTDREGNPVLAETADGAAAPAYTFNSAGANRALELIGKDLGMFVDRKDIRLRRVEDLSRDELLALLADLGTDTDGTTGAESEA